MAADHMPNLTPPGKTILRFTSAIACVALVACASTYKAPAGKPTAFLSFEVVSQSTRAMTRSVSALALSDELACKMSSHGLTLGGASFAGASEHWGPIDVVSGEPFAFAVAYEESRPGGHAICSVTATFVPEQDRSYVARLRTVRETESCTLSIVDRSASSAPVAMTTPLLTCAHHPVFKDRVANGMGTSIRQTVTVRSQ
jgi:hypothetical protein